MTMLQPTLNLPKLSLPTGFEGLQRAALSKRQLADAMLARGLATEGPMNNWAQVLGEMAQTWAGKSMQRDADKLDSSLADKMMQAYSAKRAAFSNDTRTLSPQQIVEKYSSDPLLATEVKPYQDAFEAGLKQDQEYTIFGGKMVRKKDALGQYNNDPNKMVFTHSDGSMELNPVAVTAAGLSNGSLVPTNGYQSTGQMPEEAQAMMTDILRNARQEGAAVLAQTAVVPIRDPATGQTYYKINGKYYDNPEGR